MKRQKENVAITITVPKELLTKIEKDAKENMRTRSGQVAKMINDHYNKK